MAQHRGTLFALLVFATALGAVAAAGLTGWLRCGRDSDCAPQLALAVVAFAPAGLIGALAVLWLRTKLVTPWLRAWLLALGVAVAALPLAAILLQDVRLLPVFLALMVSTVVLVLWGEGQPAPEAPQRPAAPAGPATPPARSYAEPTPVDGQREVALSPAGRLVTILQELAALNSDIIRLCERLSQLDSAAASPAGHRTQSR